MLAGWAALIAAMLYLLILFGLAHYGDTRGAAWLRGKARPTVYALTLAVYCTSWTFLGSVGLASKSGLDFLPIYLGPLIGILLFDPGVAGGGLASDAVAALPIPVTVALDPSRAEEPLEEPHVAQGARHAAALVRGRQHDDALPGQPTAS